MVQNIIVGIIIVLTIAGCVWAWWIDTHGQIPDQKDSKTATANDIAKGAHKS